MNYAILLALDAILGHKSAHSFATGPVIADPFISPLLLTITPALSSKYIKVPSFLRNGFRCRITTAGITVTIKVYFSPNLIKVKFYDLIFKILIKITFFPKLWLSFLHGSDNHITGSSCW